MCSKMKSRFNILTFFSEGTRDGITDKISTYTFARYTSLIDICTCKHWRNVILRLYASRICVCSCTYTSLPLNSGKSFCGLLNFLWHSVIPSRDGITLLKFRHAVLSMGLCKHLQITKLIRFYLEWVLIYCSIFMTMMGWQNGKCFQYIYLVKLSILSPLKKIW